MKKTIFSKLMNLSLAIVLMSGLVLGSVHFLLIQHYISSEETERLKNEVSKIKHLTELLLENYSTVGHKFYQLGIDDVSTDNNCYVIVADKEGNIIAGSSNYGEIIPEGKVDPGVYSDILDGTRDTSSSIVVEPSGVRLLAVSSAVKMSGQRGVVSLLVNMPLINEQTYSMMSLLLVSVGLSMLLSMILSYFLSMNMSKPIKRLSVSAKEIAKGDFSKRSVVSGVAELDELGAAFDKMASELDKQEQSRSAFLANVSHDLRTPMTTISGFVQGILDDTIPPEREKEYLKVVLSETNRLSDLISMFLDASRYDAGEIKLNKMNFDINEMLRTVLLQYETKINEKNINVNFDIDAHSAPVFADEQALRRVLVNLMDNAVKFSNEGGTISVCSVHSGKKVMVSVENTGDGIKGDDLKYIWDRFYKTDKSRLRDKKGVGLGLFIVKNIINQHGETITVQSENGVTKFTFSLQNAS